MYISRYGPSERFIISSYTANVQNFAELKHVNECTKDLNADRASEHLFLHLSFALTLGFFTFFPVLSFFFFFNISFHI